MGDSDCDDATIMSSLSSSYWILFLLNRLLCEVGFLFSTPLLLPGLPILDSEIVGVLVGVILVALVGMALMGVVLLVVGVFSVLRVP